MKIIKIIFLSSINICFVYPMSQMYDLLTLQQKNDLLDYNIQKIQQENELLSLQIQLAKLKCYLQSGKNMNWSLEKALQVGGDVREIELHIAESYELLLQTQE